MNYYWSNGRCSLWSILLLRLMSQLTLYALFLSMSKHWLLLLYFKLTMTNWSLLVIFYLCNEFFGGKKYASCQCVMIACLSMILNITTDCSNIWWLRHVRRPALLPWLPWSVFLVRLCLVVLIYLHYNVPRPWIFIYYCTYSKGHKDYPWYRDSDTLFFT